MPGVRAVCPLPVRDDWTPAYLRSRGDGNRDFAFLLADAQGAPDHTGVRRHGGVDWIAPGGTVVVAPEAGRVIRADRTGDTSGQVYGGVLAIETPSGRTWVMRHVDPTAPLGRDVRAGEPVATVTRWSDAPASSHAHIEIHRSASGGYKISNMLDPREVEWLDTPPDTEEPELFYFEELPAIQGGTGPDVVGVYARADLADNAARLRRERGEAVSTLAGDDGKHYVLRWAPGTHGRPFRWGGWVAKAHRDATAATREHNTGRRMRRYRGRRSLYPYPKAL